MALVRRDWQGGDFDGVERGQAALGADFELAERFDRVAEEFNSHGMNPIGGKNVDDAAARREFTGKLDGGCVLEAVLGEPTEQLGGIDFVTDGQTLGALGQQLGRGNGLEQRLDAGDDNGGYLGGWVAGWLGMWVSGV